MAVFEEGSLAALGDIASVMDSRARNRNNLISILAYPGNVIGLCLGTRPVCKFMQICILPMIGF
jgi:hypothetical protein